MPRCRLSTLSSTVALSALVLSAWSCAPPPDVVAVFDSGQVTEDELDDAELMRRHVAGDHQDGADHDIKVAAAGFDAALQPGEQHPGSTPQGQAEGGHAPDIGQAVGGTLAGLQQDDHGDHLRGLQRGGNG